MYEYKVDMEKFKVSDVYDGDTVRLHVDLGFHISFYEKFRLARIDAPEIRGSERQRGIKSRNFLRTVLNKAKVEKKEVIVRTIKDRKGKYGRYLAELFVDGENINDLLVREGYAQYVEY